MRCKLPPTRKGYIFLSAIGCSFLILLSGRYFHAHTVCQKHIPHPVAPERVTALSHVPGEHSSACISKRHRVVFVAVTVKDRINYVKLFAENLEWLNISCVADVHVFDNGSKQFSASDLQNWFPYAEIHQLDTLQDADMATRRAFEYFISSSNLTTLVNMDSDSLLHPDWATFVSQVLPESDGALSLYHSAAPHHPSFNCNNITCEKKTTGALGMVFERKILEDALDNVAASKNGRGEGFDWALCSYLENKGKKILVPRHSLVFHYGLHGAHGDGSSHVEVDAGFDLGALPVVLRGQVRFFLEHKFVMD